MKREEIADLMAFVVVAEERSFTRAAARLSMAQSALSQIVRRIEERSGSRLLTRTTRSVVPTEAGEHLLSVLGPDVLHDIDSALASLSQLEPPIRDNTYYYCRTCSKNDIVTSNAHIPEIAS
ncbi:LysR family transcriptional regulator [Escherichia coli]